MTTHHIRRWTPLAAVALAALPLSNPPASADSDHRVRHVQFESTPGAQQFDLEHAVVSGTRRVVPYTRSDATLTGDFTGGSVSAGVGTGNGAGQLAGSEIVLFNGSVTGCGSGGATISIYAEGTLGGRLSGTWLVAAAQGSGELSRVEGGGMFDTPPSGNTKFRGTITCS